MEIVDDLMYLRTTMRKALAPIFFATFWVLLGFQTVGQNLNRDSLSTAYLNATTDSARLTIGNQLVQAIQTEDIDSAYQLGITLLELATEIDDSVMIAQLNNRLGNLTLYKGDNYSSLQYQLTALRYYRALKDTAGLSLGYNNVGESYFELDLYNDAYDNYNKSLRMARDRLDTLGETIATYNIGKVLKAQGQLVKAQYYLQEALELSKAIGDSVGIPFALRDFGEVQLLTNRPQQALVTLKEALDAAMRLNEDFEMQLLIPDILNQCAHAYKSLGNYDSAIICYDEAIEYYEKLNNDQKKASSLLGKGDTYMKRGNYAAARNLFNEALSSARNRQDPTLLSESYLALATLDEQQGYYQSALEMFKRYKNTEDSIFTQQKAEQFAQLQIKYETENKDLEIEVLNQKQKQQDAKLKNEEFIRNVLVVILAFTAILLFTLYRSGTKRKEMNEKLIQQQEELEKNYQEKEKLLAVKDKFFSIVSHDLRSPINALVGILDMLDAGHLTQKELVDITKSLRIRLDRTRGLLDSLLDWAMVQMNEIEIKHETINLKKLVDENLQYFKEVNDKHIKFSNDTKGIEVRADYNMLDLIVRNLISNAVKFTQEKGKVDIAAQVVKDEVIVTVKDDGVGMSKEQAAKLFDQATIFSTPGTANEKGTGLGLKLCRDFIERLNGKIWAESNLETGTTISFTLPKASK